MESELKKKKVLYVITKSNFGGAQRYVYDLATSLPRESYTPVVALGGTGEKNAPHGTLQHKLEEKSIRVIPVVHFMRDMSLIDDVRVFFELFSIVRKERPDVLHVTSSKAGGIGVLIGRLLRVPRIIFTSHGLAYDETWRPQWQRALIGVFTWLTMALSTHTIQITQDTYTRASQLPLLKKRNVLVYNGIDTPLLMSREEARALLHNTEHTEEEWIGTIAELTKNKNLSVLIEALALVHEKGRKPHLWIIGEGEERENISHLITKVGLESYVHLPGYVNNASCVLRAFDIFSLPSLKEGLPYVLMEAGYASLPVVVSDINGIKDIVTHEKTGLMVQAEAQAFADALLTLLTDKPLAEKYGTELHTYVTSTFSIERMVTQTSTLY